MVQDKAWAEEQHMEEASRQTLCMGRIRHRKTETCCAWLWTFIRLSRQEQPQRIPGNTARENSTESADALKERLPCYLPVD